MQNILCTIKLCKGKAQTKPTHEMSKHAHNTVPEMKVEGTVKKARTVSQVDA